MNKLNSTQIFKIIIGIMWSILTLVCLTFCALPCFSFTPADFGMAEGLITGGASVLIGLEHGLNKLYPLNKGDN